MIASSWTPRVSNSRSRPKRSIRRTARSRSRRTATRPVPAWRAIARTGRGNRRLEASRRLPSKNSHKTTRPSIPAESSRFGPRNARPVTPPRWRSSSRVPVTGTRSAVPQTATSPSLLPVAKREASGDRARTRIGEAACARESVDLASLP